MTVRHTLGVTWDDDPNAATVVLDIAVVPTRDEQPEPTGRHLTLVHTDTAR